ncbi:MAG: argininosuccinate lyase, partial [Acidobacteriota bacterium]
MSRFREDPDPRFWRLNRSIEFDRHLAPYDIAQSRAHARALSRIGVITEPELAELDRALAGAGAELESGEFEFVPGDEDIHMAIERRLGELIGELAGKLHTGRSRNDQVATDICLAVIDRSARSRALIAAVMARLLDLAEVHADWAMPGYTHLQRAQPVYLGHHLLAYFWMLSRDFNRFASAGSAASVMPLGSGALAGVNWEIDRQKVADELGFKSVTANSLDATSNRDYVLDYLAAASICGTHLSRLGSELVIWSSSEFAFCRIAEPFTSGSSIMPQKQNPDSAELLRAKAPRLVADLTTLLGALHALPLTYGKDMQEDKEPFFDAVETIEASLEMTVGILEGIEFDRDRLLDASGDEMLAATEVA